MAIAALLVAGSSGSDARAEPPADDLAREIAALKAFYLGATTESPPPSVEEMVAGLGGRSGPSRLRHLLEIVRQSDAALPLLHARLASAGDDPRAMGTVLLALGIIGDPSSAGPILEVAKTGDPKLRFPAWQALMLLPPDEAVTSFALEQAADPGLHIARKKGAHAVLALHREVRAQGVAQALLESSVLAERATGVWILGSIGVDVREPALELLAAPDLRSSRALGPLLALAETTGPDELRAITPAFRQKGDVWDQALRVSTWRHAPPADARDRAALCVEMLRESMPPGTRDPVRCLLELNRQDLLLRDVLSIKGARGAYVLGMLQREGWQMVVEPRDVRLEARPGA